MTIFHTIFAAVLVFFRGPGPRLLHDVAGVLIQQLGPVLFAELVELAKREVARREVSVAPNEKRHAQVAAALQLAARAAGFELTNTMCDIIIKGALLLIRQGA